jgi:cell wall-associated protease
MHNQKLLKAGIYWTTQKDSFYGISINKAYTFLKEKNKTNKPVIVAVLDSGVDTTHEDLKNILWRNPKEIPGNGIDDDGNGYIDDVYGWNFLGGKDGRDVSKASDERSRIYHRLKTKFSAQDLDTNALSQMIRINTLPGKKRTKNLISLWMNKWNCVYRSSHQSIKAP